MCLGLCLLLGLLILGTEPGTAPGEEGAHPGVCPPPSSQPQHVPCPNACDNDRGCLQDQKCCFTACGFGCVTPLRNGSSDLPPPGDVDWSLSQAEDSHQGELQKPGLCPRDFTRCLHQEPPLCTNDSVCPGWLKCCSHECRLRCTPPAEEKPGACPAAAPEGLFYPCSFRCQEDKDCLGSQKCCPLGCGSACVEPAQDICHLPAVPGPCGGHELSFFYNVTSGRCETFPYSGCGGNANRFGTRAACRRACLGHEKPKAGECPAVLPELEGPCREECDGDSDCPKALKCCNSSCGLQCLPAVPARKDGFCPASAGLFPSYDCREWCRYDADCPGEERCCLRGCDYVCLRPAQEKPGICPLSEQAAGSQCQAPCAGDEQCPGNEKCCSSRCGRVCVAPEPDKPGRCPKVRPQLTSEPCTEDDACLHDRDCPRQEKCCFSGCAMRCSRPAREHPGQCPRAEPCWDPRRRRRNQCLDDSVCGRDEKCCNTGCAWACVAVPRESGGGASGQCTEECETDTQCPQGQRCTHTGCSRVCMEIPGGRVGVCPIPRDAGTCLDLCSFDEECPWGQKCCSNGCGHICMPVSLEERDVAVVPQHSAGRCSEQCDADSQCPRGQRCTRTSCGRVCTDVPRGKEGACPIPRGSGTCLDLCSSSKECPQGQKCCSNGCGHVCTWIPDAAVNELLALLAGRVVEEADEERLAVPADRGQVAEVCVVPRAEARVGLGQTVQKGGAGGGGGGGRLAAPWCPRLPALHPREVKGEENSAGRSRKVGPGWGPEGGATHLPASAPLQLSVTFPQISVD
ncbi:papilin-like isoform X3 [Numida meleagris]|uniref:papilin-like isoform X3 n=1 Tax=Numida meleagris TaxID=8996 RepID=UPI000B3DA6F7|nr:papilin-like isoform X3 [Numida meleagris]